MVVIVRRDCACDHGRTEECREHGAISVRSALVERDDEESIGDEPRIGQQRLETALQPLIGDRDVGVVSVVLIVGDVQREGRQRAGSDVGVERHRIDDVCSAARPVVLNVEKLEKRHVMPDILAAAN